MKIKSELKNRSKFKSMLLHSHIKCDQNKIILDDNKNVSDDNKITFRDNKTIGYTDKYSSEEFQSTDYKHNFYDFSGGNIELPNASNLLILIKSEYVDDQYRFNVSNQPVTTRYPNSNTCVIDGKYIKHIKRSIQSWNELFYKYYQTNEQLLVVKDIKLFFVLETLNEFIIKANVSLLYLGKTLHLQVSYYGEIERTDDFLNGQTDKYVLQVTEVRPITKTEFGEKIIPATSQSDTWPFMSMYDQMKYVDRINKLHQSEYNKKLKI